MKTISPFLLALICWRSSDTTVTLSFKEMHCKECEETLTEALKKVAGVKAVIVAGAQATVTVGEGTRFDYGKFKASCPRDLKLVSVGIELRGIVSENNGAFTLTSKGSKQAFTLGLNDDQKKSLQALMGGKNVFQIAAAAAADSATLTVQSFSKVE